MYILLPLFFISLIGIVILIGRKLMLIQNGVVFHVHEFHPFMPDVRKVRSFLWRKTRIYAYATLVFLVRRYITVRNFLKYGYAKTSIYIKRKLGKNPSSEMGEVQEPSPFLQKIADYKQRIIILREKIERENKLKRKQ